MIDLDKLIEFAYKVFKNRVGLTPLLVRDFLKEALAYQGLMFDVDGNIVLIEKETSVPMELEKANVYICIKDVWQPEGQALDFCKDHKYFCPANGFLISEGGCAIKPYVINVENHFKKVEK